jgi:hypothetical protein
MHAQYRTHGSTPATHLEGQPQVLAVVVHGLLLLLVHVAEHGTAAAAGCYEAGGLVEGLVQVLLQRDLRVKQRSGLADLAICKVCDDLGDEFNDLAGQDGAAGHQAE